MSSCALFISFLFSLLVYVSSLDYTPIAVNMPKIGYLNAGYVGYSIATAGQNQSLHVVFTSVVGGPSIFISNDGKDPVPSDSHSYWRAHTGSFFVVVPYTTAVNVKIAVAAAFFSNFSVLAYFGEAAPTIVPGFPQYGQASGFGSMHYEFFANPNSTIQISISATRGILLILVRLYLGTPRIFVGTDPNSFPDASHNTICACIPSTAPVVNIPSTFSPWPVDNKFRLSIPGFFFQISFVISISISSASDPGAIVVLQDGIPHVDQLSKGEYEYFEYYVSQQNCNLGIIVTALTGDPDLYVSRTINEPNQISCRDQGNECSVSTGSGGDSVSYPNAATGSYYIGVRSYSRACSFSIVGSITCAGSSNTSNVLLDGMPQFGTVALHQWVYYSFSVFDQFDDVTLSLSRQTGDPDIYISNDNTLPSRDHYRWKSTTSGSDVLSLLHTDDGFYYNNGSFLVGVYGFTPAQFTIVMTSGSGSLRLSDGVAFQEDVQAKQFEYFEFVVTDQSADLTITVTALGRGDPDLYVSTKDNRPNKTNAMWSAESYLADSITIPSFQLTLGHVFISVYAFSACSFTILASSEQDVELQEGVYQSGSVSKMATRYYEISMVPTADDLTFVLTTSGCMANLYVSTFMHPDSRNASTYDYSVLYYSSVKNIRLPSLNELSLPPPDKNGANIFYAAVYGVTNCNYSINAFSSSATIQLQSGVAVYRHVQSTLYDYFSIQVLNPNMTLTIVVTPVSSVDPDLYVSTKHRKPTDSEDMHEWHETSFGGAILTISNANISTYYMAVYNNVNFTYTIVAFINDPFADPASNIVWLNDGIPQVGFQLSFHFQLYGFFLSSLASNLRIDVQALKFHGDPDLYVALNRLPLNDLGQDVSQWKSKRVGSDSVDIDNPTPGLYYIAVRSFASISAWTITASTSNSITMLRDSVPVEGSLSKHQKAYYYLPVDRWNDDIVIAVTALSGGIVLSLIRLFIIDPDLYISTVTSFPNNISNSQWRSTHASSDIVTIVTTDQNFCGNCRYYICVSAFSDTVYTISASFSSEQGLLNGVPQRGSVALRGWVYFKFSVYEEHEDITINLTPLNGRTNMLVGNNKKPNFSDRNSYQWSSYIAGGNIIIRHTDANFCFVSSKVLGSCIYHVGVYGVSAANFSLTVSSSHASVQLQDGVPVREWVSTGQWEYFVYTVNHVPEEGSFLTFTVTALTGDPDIFVSNTSSKPNSTNSVFSRSLGSDVVTIPLPVKSNYYVGIYSFRNCTFTLLVQHHSRSDTEVVTSLINGVPQAGAVSGFRFFYYQLILNEVHEQILISINRRYGFPLVYLTVDGSFPSSTNNYRSIDTFQESFINLSPANAGTYMIGIFSSYDEVGYTVLAATSDTLITLIDGIPFRDNLIAGQYEYFQFFIDSLDRDLVISLTPFAGDPDLYTATYPRPNTTHFEGKSALFSGDALTIPSSTFHSIGMYYISVYAYSNASFSIIASFSNTKLLQDGIPQSGVLSYRVVQYFTFDSPTNSQASSLSFTLTPLNGANMFLYVSTTEKPNPSVSSTYQWKSVYWYTQQQIVIRKDDANFCENCRYFVAVLSLSTQNAFFVLTASAAASNELQDGVPSFGMVTKNSYRNYSIIVPDDDSILFISVTTSTGDPDLYVSRLYKPSREKYQWISKRAGSDSIVILPGTTNYGVGTYYIAVYGYSNTTFSIIASITHTDTNSSAPTSLINGQPQTGFALNRRARMYKFEVGAGHEHHLKFSILVTPIQGDPDIYVRDDGAPVSTTSYKWKSSGLGRDIISIPNSCTNCTYSIMIYGFSQTLFQIVASTSDAAIFLDSGVPVNGAISNGYENYAIVVPNGVAELYITVQAVGGGDPDLYVSTVTSTPTIQNHTWFKIAFGDDRLSIMNPQNKVHYIAVYASEYTSYTITATVWVAGVPQTIIFGQPVFGHVETNLCRQYIFSVSDSLVGAITASLTSVDSGEGTLYITSSLNYTWKTDASSRSTVVLDPADVNFCSNCTYYTAVCGVVSTSYTLLLTTGPITLYPGYPYFSKTVLNTPSLFLFYVDNLEKDVLVSLTTYYGGANVFILGRPGSTYPDATNYDWNITSYTQQVLLSHTSSHFPNDISRPVLLSVNDYPGSSASTVYSILITTNSIRLLDGYTQSVNFKPSVYVFFMFSLSSVSPVTFTIADLLGANSDTLFNLYISTRATNWEPTSSSNDFELVTKAGMPATILTTNPKYCTNCVYYIGILATVASSQNFLVTAATSNSIQVLIDKADGSVSGNAFKYYEVFISRALNYVIKLDTCIGSAYLYASDTLTRPTRNSYRYKSENPDSVDTISISSDFHGDFSLFIGVYDNSKSSPPMSTYELTVINGTAVDIAPTPTNVLITATYLDEGNMHVEWALATSTKYTSNELIYTLYTVMDRSEEGDTFENPVLYSKCGLEYYGSASPSNGQVLKSGKISQTVHGLRSGAGYFFNVLVSDPSGAYTAYSHSSRISTGNSDGGSNSSAKLILSVGIPVFIVLILILAYMFYRNRKLSQELDIEMHDVPKKAIIKAVRGTVGNAVESKQTEKYSALLQETVDDDNNEYMIHSDYAAAIDISDDHPPVLGDSDRDSILHESDRS